LIGREKVKTRRGRCAADRRAVPAADGTTRIGIALELRLSAQIFQVQFVGPVLFLRFMATVRWLMPG
jgi:hypothetical protein